MSDHEKSAEERAEKAGSLISEADKAIGEASAEQAGPALAMLAGAEAQLSSAQRLARLAELLEESLAAPRLVGPPAGAMPGTPSSEPATLQQGDGPVVELGSGLSSEHYHRRNWIRNELRETGQELPSVEQATADVAAAAAAATKAAEKAEKASQASREADEDEQRARIKLELATEAAIEKAGS